MFWDSLDDIFASVTNVAKLVAPIALPAAAAFGATKLLGGTNNEAWLSAGVAGATSGVLGSMGERQNQGALGKAGIASGAVSGPAATGPQIATSSAVQPTTASKGILDGLGIQGSDLLKLGGQVLSSLDDTDDKLRERALDIRERERRVNPVNWNPRMPSVHSRQRDPDDITNRRVI